MSGEKLQKIEGKAETYSQSRSGEENKNNAILLPTSNHPSCKTKIEKRGGDTERRKPSREKVWPDMKL